MLYIKIIAGQEKISECKVLYLDGHWVSNPTQEQIFADGWSIYNPPVPPPVPQTEPGYEDLIASIKKMFSTDIETLSDEEALEVAALYDTWAEHIGDQVEVGKRLWYDGRLWKVIQAHTIQEDWNPVEAVSLFVEVSVEEWPEWRQPAGGHDAYMAGDKVTHLSKHWINEIDYNSFEPGVYGWREAI